MGFGLTINQNQYLAEGETELHAVLSVDRTADQDGDAPAGRQADLPVAEVILIDCSGSMDWPPTKIHAARQATQAAIDVLRDGTRFAVVAGDGEARMVYPDHRGLATAGQKSRAKAKAAVHRLIAGGGTAISRWLLLAHELLADQAAFRHVTLLTDGQNGETGDELPRALARCQALFQCDARGIGDDWSAKQLIEIATALRGTADAVPVESELADEFRRIIDGSMQKTVADVRIRIALTRFAEFRFLRQQFPTKTDLREHVTRIDDRTTEISTGAWGDEETREYLLCIGVGDAGALGEDVRAARIDLMVGGEQQATPAPVVLHRTDASDPSLLDNSAVSHYHLQTQLTLAVDDGCDGYWANSPAQMLASWGRAVALAVKTRDERMYSSLGKVVHIDDAAAGRVRLRDPIARRDVLALETGSIKTGHSWIEQQSEVPAPGPDKVCECSWRSPPDAKYCSKCRKKLAS